MPITQPLPAYRFRVSGCNSSITDNVESVHIDFMNKTIAIQVRATVLGNDFEVAIDFGRYTRFYIEALDGSSEALFTIHPLSMQVKKHDMEFSYKHNGCLFHNIVFSYKDIDTHYILSSQSTLPVDPNFSTPQEAMARYEKSKKVDTKTGKEILTETIIPAKTVTIMDDPIDRDEGC